MPSRRGPPCERTFHSNPVRGYVAQKRADSSVSSFLIWSSSERRGGRSAVSGTTTRVGMTSRAVTSSMLDPRHDLLNCPQSLLDGYIRYPPPLNRRERHPAGLRCDPTIRVEVR